MHSQTAHVSDHWMWWGTNWPNVSSHREEEGRDLLGKRTMDFKVTYLDGGLGAMTDRSGFLSDSDFILRCQRTRRYKSQIRDVVTNCRSSGKRKLASVGDSHPYSAFEDGSNVSAVNAATHAAAVSATASYQNTPMYPYGDNMNGLSSYAAAAAAAAMPQNIFSAAIDHNSRPFLAPENFLHYSRHALGPYYPDYHPAAQYPSNGFLDHMSTSRTAHCFPGAYAPDAGAIVKENSVSDKLYGCQMANESKFSMNEAVVNTNGRTLTKTSCCDSYMTSATTPCSLMSASTTIHQPLLADPKIADIPSHRNFGLSSAPNDCLSVIKHKTGLPLLTSNSMSHRTDHNSIDTSNTTCASTTTTSQSILSAFSSANNIDSRQSVLMWGTNHNFGARAKYGLAADIKPNERVVSCKWNGSIANPKPLSPHPSVAHSPSSAMSAKVPMSVPIAGYTAQTYNGTDVSPIEV